MKAKKKNIKKGKKKGTKKRGGRQRAKKKKKNKRERERKRREKEREKKKRERERAKGGRGKGKKGGGEPTQARGGRKEAAQDAGRSWLDGGDAACQAKRSETPSYPPLPGSAPKKERERERGAGRQPTCWVRSQHRNTFRGEAKTDRTPKKYRSSERTQNSKLTIWEKPPRLTDNKPPSYHLTKFLPSNPRPLSQESVREPKKT